MPDQPVAASTPRRKRTRGDAIRRLLERLFLGTVMSAIALILDRRLRRTFTKR